MSDFDVTVIIPTYGDRAPLMRCLAALEAQTYPADRFEVLLVENGPEPWEAHGLGGTWRVLHEPQAGSYAARNRALRDTLAPLIAFTDADCLPAPDWIEQGVAAFAADPSLERLAGTVDLLPPSRETAASLHERAFGLRQDLLVARGTALTANLWVRRAAMARVGPFDTAHRSGGDTAWGWRASELGVGLVYGPTVRVAHPTREDFQTLAQKSRRVYGGAFARLYPANHPRWRTLLRGLALIKPPIRRMRDALSGGRISPTQGWWVATVEIALRWVQLAEHVRLTFGGEPRR
jgi:glycosyltransferase involved in cell wall biosynthesis